GPLGAADRDLGPGQHLGVGLRLGGAGLLRGIRVLLACGGEVWPWLRLRRRGRHSSPTTCTSTTRRTAYAAGPRARRPPAGPAVWPRSAPSTSSAPSGASRSWPTTAS